MEVGIDIGGTHTRVLVAEGTSVLAEVATATSQWRRGTLFSDRGNADRLLRLIPLNAVGRPDVPIAAGVSGCDTDEQCATFAAWLGSQHPGPVEVVNDSELFGPAMGLTDSINVVAGTGSIIVGRDADRRIIKTGGYGWILGDPGSAPGLVRHAVIEICRADDTGASPGPLARALMAHYDVPDPVELGYAFTADAEATHWGALCPLVFEAAAAGDALARQVIVDDAEAIADDISLLCDRGVSAREVVLGGGVAMAQPSLTDAITAAVGRRRADLRVSVLDRPPVQGALRIAMSLRDRVLEPSGTEPAALAAKE